MVCYVKNMKQEVTSFMPYVPSLPHWNTLGLEYQSRVSLRSSILPCQEVLPATTLSNQPSRLTCGNHVNILRRQRHANKKRAYSTYILRIISQHNINHSPVRQWTSLKASPSVAKLLRKRSPTSSSPRGQRHDHHLVSLYHLGCP